MNASPLLSTHFYRLLKVLAAALIICGGAAAAHAQIARPFTQIFTTNKQADIAIIGNTLHTSSNGAVRANAAATNLLVNNANWMARVDVDSNTNTFTSSAASFTLPTNGAVMFAKLYWGAGTNAGNGAAQGAPTPGLRGQVLLSFNGGAYVSITNTTLDQESSGNRYQGSRDITDFVRTNGSGSYQVANVQSSTGSNTLAGWSIVIAYTDPAAPPRNIALYDGYANVQGTNIVDIPISGFTTPQFNAVVTRIGVVAYEGDSGLSGGVYTGDQMRLNGTRLPAVFDASTPTNDVFNSTISRLGTRVSAKNPDYTNQLGYDLKVLNATGVLTNTATSATITLTTGGETYYPGAVAFATELYAPQIAIPKTVTDVNGGAVNPGDVLLYNLSVTNSGGDWATNTFLIDPIPAGTTYVPNSFQITEGANVGLKTDAAGDDQLDFTNGVLTVRLGMGANAINGGTLSTNETTAMSFFVRVNTNILHGTRLTNQATLSYSALVTGVAFASASTAAEVQVDAGIFGRVFEDVNYTGGAGRNYLSSAGVGLANARVELYGPLNNFLGFTLTDANGVYGFSNISAAAYSVRVVNSSVVSSRPGGGTPGLLPVQTFRTDASSGAATDLVNLVGGANPGATDPASSVFTGAQSVSAVGVTNNLYTGGVDFGFNFNTIVSTNSTGQGSARQFITNVNALVGLDRAVIMIPDGSASPGLNPAYDFTVGGFRTLAPSAPLPAITDAVLFDATTVPGYAGTPLVRLSGVNAGAGANGLIFASSGSTLRGVAIHSFSGSGIVLTSGTNNTIAANVFGADPTGTIPLPNGTGVLIATNATNNVIGGTVAGAANLIAFNTGAGVAVTGTTNVGNQIRRNSIFSNGGSGIDLNNNGVTLNDLNDADTGGNTLFNSPVITNAIISGANLVISGYARPGSVIELFIAEPDATGFGEGRTYLATVTEGVSDADATSGTYSGTIHGLNQGTDNTARFSFTIPLPPGVSVGTVLTATATDAAGNTSEFGGNAPVGGLADLAVAKTGPASVVSLSNITYTINATNLGPATAVNVIISDTLPAGVAFVSASSGGVLSNNIVTWPAITNLASGARTNYTLTVTAPVGGSITNVASGEADNVDPTPGNNDGSNPGARVVTAVTPQADVAVTVSGPTNVLAGENYTYTITVANFGPATATNVITTNLLPVGVTYVTGTGVASVGGNTVTFNTVTLASNDIATFTVTVTAPPSGSLTNRASGAAVTPDPVVANNNGNAGTAVVITTVTPQADVVVAKSGPSSVIAGSNFTYTISITNLGPSTASNVVASDALPAQLNFISASGGGSLGTNNIVTWPAVTLASGARTNYTLTVNTASAGTFTNIASALSPTGDPNPTNNNGSATGSQVVSTSSLLADLVVTVSGPTNVLAGATYAYTVSITNLGPSVATNVLATNALPAGVTFVSTTGSGTQSGGEVTWPVITLPSGAFTNFTITVTAPPSGVLTNRASGASDVSDPVPANNNGSAVGAIVVTTVTPQADVAVTKTGPASVLAGANLTYTITVTNAGPSTASNIIAQDFLPTNATFVSASSGGTLGASNIVTWPATTLLANGVTNFTVTITAPASGSLLNRAAANSPTGDPNPTNNVGTNTGSQVTTTVTPQADVVVTVSGPSTVLAGGNYTYTVSITNLGPSVATNALATNALPGGVVFVSTTGGGSQSGGHVTWPPITLPSGSGTNFTITVTAPPSGVLTNTAAGASLTPDPDLSNNNGSASGAVVVTTVTPQADVGVTKSGPASVLAGANLTYTISVTNFGPSTASNVLVVDNLPATVTFSSASGGGSYDEVGFVSWSNITLPSGAGTNFIITVTAPPSGTLINSVSSVSLTPDPVFANNNGTAGSALVTTTVTPQADVVVTVSGPSTVLAGATYTYTVSITNLGPSVATNALATNALPPGVAFVSTTSGGSQSGGNVTWPAITLASGAETNFTITVTAPPSGTLINTASGSSLTPDPVLANNNGTAGSAIVTTTVTPQADIAVGKSGPATVLAGANVTYTISVTNLGPSTASSVSASDTLPVNATFVSASFGGVLSNGVVTWPGTNLLSGQRQSYTVTVQAPADGTLFNTASATSPTGDPNPTNNVGTNASAQVTTTVTPQADLAVSKSGPATVLAGQNLTYTITVTNLGPSTASNVIAQDDLPATATFVSASGGGTLGASNIVTWPATTIFSGASASFTVTVSAPASGVLINRASATSPTGDPNPTNNVGTNTESVVTTSVTPQADVAVGKSGPAGVTAGASFTYTISITNFGPSTASNVVAVDNLPASVTFVSASGGGTLGGGNIVTWPATTLASNAVTSFTVTVTAPASGIFTNAASASSPTGDPNPTNNNGTATGSTVVTTVGVSADVVVLVSGPVNVLAGGSYNYVVSITNLGPSVATNVLATNALPAGVVFVSSTGGGTESGGNVTWPPITLPSGSGTNFTITVTAPPSGVLTNRATGSSLTPDPDLSNNDGSASGAIVLTSVTPQADVAVSKSGPATVLAGQTLTYTITVTNAGPSTADNVVAQDYLPATATFVSANLGGTLGVSNIVTWPARTILSGASALFTVTVTAPASGVLINRAAATSPTGDPNPTNNVGTNTESMVTTGVTPQADLVVTVSGPSTVLAGGTYTYTVSITNLGPSVATNALATNALPPGVAFVSTTGGGSQSGGNVTWPAITLTSGEGTSFTITVTAPPSGTLLNTASGASLTADPVLANNNGTAGSAIVTTTVTPQADVGVTKSGPASVLAGQSLTYTITVTNAGPSIASNIIAQDFLPTNATFVSASSGGTLGASNIVSWPATTLLANTVTNFTVTVTAPASGSLLNRAAANSPTGDPNPTNNVGTNTGSQVTTTVTPQADVAVGKSGPGTVLAGANFTYTISVTNFGPSTASNVTVLDDLPATVTFVSASAGAFEDFGNVSWTTPALLSGAVTNFTVTVTAPASGSFTNIATATSPTGDPNPGNNSSTNGGGQVTTTVTPQADVAVGKTGPATVLAGANLTYTISVTNFGPSTASNIVTVDALPANATFVSASGDGTLGGGNVVTWPTTTLISGATATFTVTVTAPASGSLFNSASASSPTSDPNPTNNVGTNTGSQVSTTITPLADIVVTVSGPTNAVAGSNITYTITITNLGPSVATNAFVTNALPPGVVVVSIDGGGTETNGVVTWPQIPTLPSGGGTNFTVTIVAPPSGTLTNSAGGGSTTIDPNLNNNNASSPGGVATTEITPQADVAVLKTGPATVTAGSNFVFTITVTNFGPSTASNVVVVDNLPASVTFVSASDGGTLGGGNVVTWPATTLAANAGVSFTVTVTTEQLGAITNSASATSPTGDPNPGNNTGTNTGSRVVTTVVSGVQFAYLAAPAVFNPQTGLFEQRVTVTNVGASTIAATRLSVTSLSTNATFHNPSGSNDGVPYAQYNSPLNPGQSVLFTLEFLVPNRRPFTNTLAVEAVLPASAGTNSGANSIAISRAFVDARPPNAPRFVIEFPSQVGRIYTILYRDDLSSPWKVATPSVTAGSTSTQWYDDGPPKTDAPPLNNASRYYRVIVAPLDL